MCRWWQREKMKALTRAAFFFLNIDLFYQFAYWHALETATILVLIGSRSNWCKLYAPSMGRVASFSRFACCLAVSLNLFIAVSFPAVLPLSHWIGLYSRRSAHRASNVVSHKSRRLHTSVEILLNVAKCPKKRSESLLRTSRLAFSSPARSSRAQISVPVVAFLLCTHKPAQAADPVGLRKKEQ